MSAVEVRPATTKAEREIIVHFPWRIYHGDPLWVPPLLPERRKMMDPQQGHFFQKGGEVEFFIAWRDGEPVGTICAAEDKQMNALRQAKECMFGCFEYIEDYQVFCALLEQVEQVARRRGLETIHGPWTNLDYEDGYGVLVEGRDRPPAILCGHTPPYYLGFIERYGFTPARGDNLAFAIDIDRETDAFRELSRMADRVKEKGRVTLRMGDFSRWDEEVELVRGLLNASTAHLVDFLPWTEVAAHAVMDPFRQIADPELLLFAVMDGKTIGFFPGVPNLNEAFIHANGLRRPWDYLKLLWYMRTRTKCLAIKSVLVLPKYWGSGAAILLFDEMRKRAVAKGYRWVDLSLTSDDNPKTPQLATRMGGRVYKRYRVYRKRIDG
jgi:GNAT superfamily N-acetyltransferase